MNNNILYKTFLSHLGLILSAISHDDQCFMSQCDPYFDDIGCSHPGCEPAYPTPKCVRKCVDGNQLWSNSKHYSVSAYRINSDPYDIMAEVYKNGPVEVSFTVYEVNESSCLCFSNQACCNFHDIFLISW